MAGIPAALKARQITSFCGVLQSNLPDAFLQSDRGMTTSLLLIVNTALILVTLCCRAFYKNSIQAIQLYDELTRVVARP